jgi:hypothetical protein
MSASFDQRRSELRTPLAPCRLGEIRPVDEVRTELERLYPQTRLVKAPDHRCGRDGLADSAVGSRDEQSRDAFVAVGHGGYLSRAAQFSLFAASPATTPERRSLDT